MSTLNIIKWIVIIMVALAILGAPIPVFDQIIGAVGHLLAGG